MEGLKILGCTGGGGAAGIHDTHNYFNVVKARATPGSPASIYIYIYLSHLNLETRNVIGRNRITCYKLICTIHR